jgi:hypothetical protein
MSSEWKDRTDRRAREAQYIIADRKITYNLCTDHKDSNNPFYGPFHTSELKNLIREALKGRPNDKLGTPISINAITYASLAEASRQTGISRKTIRKRLQDENNWIEYKILI